MGSTAEGYLRLYPVPGQPANAAGGKEKPSVCAMEIATY